MLSSKSCAHARPPPAPRWSASTHCAPRTRTRPDSLDRLQALHEFRYRRMAQRAGALDGDENLDERSEAYQRTLRALLDTQRAELVRRRDAGEISDDVLHALTRELDLEDQRLEI